MWIITVLSLIATVANIHKKRWCFIIWIFTNATWAVYDFKIGAKEQAVLFAVYFCLAIWGVLKWRG